MLKQKAIGLWAAALAAVVAALSLHPIHESDAFWHLMLGRAVLRAGARTVPEPAALPSFEQMVVVPEWLWELLTYGLHQLAGPEALSLFVAMMAGICALAVVWMLHTHRPSADRAALYCVSSLILAVLMARFRLRPQLAFLILLPSFVAVTRSYLSADGTRRRAFAALLVGMGVVWAQVHGSFVIAPVVFGILALPDLLRDWNQPRRTLHFAVCMGLLAAVVSSADGAWIVHYVLVHAAGDAARHVGDMRPSEWKDINPVSTAFGAAYLLLWAIVLLGVGMRRRVDWSALGLALFGVALALNSVRFVPTSALLLGPLALDAADALAGAMPRRLPRRVAAVALGGALLAWAGAFVHAAFGPLGVLGFSEGRHPRAAARYLAGLPVGSPVLSTFSAGPPLGFWLDGHVRTYVDTRTPLHFDDSDYAVAREVWHRPGSLALALARYEAAAIVADRHEPTCTNVPPGWVPVVVEARHTTFVPATVTTPLVALAPCGDDYVTARACEEGGAVLEAEIVRLEALDDSRFVDFLRARRIVECGGDLAYADSLLPSRNEAWLYRKSWALTSARLALAAGRPAEAVARVRAAASAGDLDALGIVMAGETSLEALREALEANVRARDDETPVEVRARLAEVCMRLGDADCVRFHGMRVAVAGSPRGPRILAWLREHHGDARVRADAQQWLDSLVRSSREAGDVPLASAAEPRT